MVPPAHSTAQSTAEPTAEPTAESTPTSQFPDGAVPLQVGLVGTGYAAKARATALVAEPRTHLKAIAGHSLARTQAFSEPFGAMAQAGWSALIADPSLDLIVIAGVNSDHGAIAQAALRAGKHVVVEYPLCLDVAEADALLALAQAQNKLLHVEHIELLGGVHQALQAALPQIGPVFYARYATLKRDAPAPQRWTYDTSLFGFPLVGALSRLHRLVELLGPVAEVSCQTQWQQGHSHFYQSCLCTAQLRFHSGVLAEVVYGKGEAIWRSYRQFEVQGQHGALLFEGDQGTLIQAGDRHPIAVQGRRGLFAKDTTLVLDHLTLGTPLYVTAAASVYTLKVAAAAQRSALEGKSVWVE
jgi:biliverdin reductase